MGTADLVPEALASCGVVPGFRKMSIKPGRPIQFGTGPSGTLVFALPGNPVSAFVGFALLVRPALARRQGRPDTPERWFSARCSTPLKATANRRTYIPSIARTGTNGVWQVEPTRWHGSGDVFGLARANALIMRPPGAPALEADSETLALLLD